MSQYHVRSDDRIGTYLGAGHDTDVNPCPAVVPDDGAEFFHAGAHRVIVNLTDIGCSSNRQLAVIVPGTKITVLANYRVPDIVHVKPAAVTYIGALDFCGKADHAVCPEVTVLPHQSTVADDRPRPDVDRTAYDRVLQDPCIVTDDYLTVNHRPTRYLGCRRYAAFAAVKEITYRVKDVPGVFDGMPGARVGYNMN